MPTTQGLTTVDSYTTLHTWLRKVADHTIRKREVYRRLVGRGRVIYNQEGDEVVWPFKIRLPESRGYTGGPIFFPESDKYRQFRLSPKAIYASDSMDVLAQYRNRGQAALVNRKDKIGDDIRERLDEDMAEAIYLDDSQAANALKPSGVESFLGAGGTCTVADRIKVPDDTYAGVDTDLRTYNGTWSADLSTKPNATFGFDWPLGKGTSDFDATSPLLLNVTSTGWTAGKNTVADNLEEVISIGALWLGLTRGEQFSPDICVLSPDYWTIYAAIQRAKQQIVVPHSPGQDVGFRGFQQDGVLVMTEYGVPSQTGYLLNTKTAKLHCWFPQLFMPFFNQFELRSFATLWVAMFYGQFEWQPRSTGKIYPYAAS